MMSSHVKAREATGNNVHKVHDVPLWREINKIDKKHKTLLASRCKEHLLSSSCSILIVPFQTQTAELDY